MESITDFIDRKRHIVTIGQIKISALPDKTYWLENLENGEGTQAPRYAVENGLLSLFNELM